MQDLRDDALRFFDAMQQSAALTDIQKLDVEVCQTRNASDVEAVVEANRCDVG